MDGVRKVDGWMTSDGELFDTEEKANNYELLQKFFKLCEEFAKEHLDGVGGEFLHVMKNPFVRNELLCKVTKLLDKR